MKIENDYIILVRRFERIGHLKDRGMYLIMILELILKKIRFVSGVACVQCIEDTFQWQAILFMANNTYLFTQ